MIKKTIIYLLIPAFLIYLIAPEFSFASDKWFEGDIGAGDIDTGTKIAITLVAVVVLVGVILIVKYASKQSQPRQDQQQKPTDTISSKIADEQRTNSSSQVALFRW